MMCYLCWILYNCTVQHILWYRGLACMVLLLWYYAIHSAIPYNALAVLYSTFHYNKQHICWYCIAYALKSVVLSLVWHLGHHRIVLYCIAGSIPLKAVGKGMVQDDHTSQTNWALEFKVATLPPGSAHLQTQSCFHPLKFAWISEQASLDTWKPQCIR